MYCDFYQLRERPFNVTADPKFLYLNARYREALASLHYGISQRKGFITLIGEAGTGKTTLLKKLLDDLDATTRTVFIFNTNVTFDEILEYIFGEFDLPVHNGKRLYMLQRLNTFLLEELRNGRNVALLIDEAQDLDFTVLEDLRLLSNLETAKEKILQIVLSGQPELGQKLGNPGLRQLRQRVAVNCRLLALTREEISEYIQSRLTAAGSADPKLFTRDAEDRIHEISTGIPRLVNIVCDNALVIGYALGKKRIGADVVNEAAADLLSVEEPAAPAPRELIDMAPVAPPVIETRARSSSSFSQLGVIAVVVVAILVGLLSVGRSLLRPHAPPLTEVAKLPREVVRPSSRLAEPVAPAVVPPASSAAEVAAPAAPDPPAAEESEQVGGEDAALAENRDDAIAEGDRVDPEAAAEVEPEPAAPVAPPARADHLRPVHPAEAEQFAAVRDEKPSVAVPPEPKERHVTVHEAPSAPPPPEPAEVEEPAKLDVAAEAPRAPAKPEKPVQTALNVPPPMPAAATGGLPIPRAEEERREPVSPTGSEADVSLALAKWQSVMVKPGDSVSEIAIRNYGQASPTILDMMKIANPSIRDIDVISVGQELQLPQLDEGFVILQRPNGAYALLLLSTPVQQRANEIEGALRKHGFAARVGRANFGAGRQVSRVLIDGLKSRDETLVVGKQLQQLFREDEHIAAMAR